MAKKTMHITLRPKERIYINGAVLRVDRKVTLELLNDAVFLIEAHIMQAEDTKTPLKQLYFAAQIVLIDPKGADEALTVFVALLGKLLKIFTDRIILDKLRDCIELAEQNRFFDILKILRSLFEREAMILNDKKETKLENKDENVKTDVLDKKLKSEPIENNNLVLEELNS